MNRHARGGRSRRRSRVLVPALAAAMVAVLGAGGYLAVRAFASRASSIDTDRPSISPTKSVSPKPTPPPTPPVGQLGDYRVADRSYSFTEPSNSEHGPRILQVSVRFPVLSPPIARDRRTGGSFPLVVFAPGYMQCGGAYRYLLTQWASAGYVVAAVNFPLTNCHIAHPDESDLSNQPADMAYVISRLLALSGHPQGPLSGLIADSKIAVAGHSDGANAAAAMAGASCCRDDKVRAAIVLAGNEWPWGGGRWFAGPTPPILFVQGTADAWNPPQYSVQLYQADKTGTRYYLDLFGANHFTPYQGHSAHEPIVAQVTLDFLDQYVAGQRGKIAQMRQAARVRGVAELVSAGKMP